MASPNQLPTAEKSVVYLNIKTTGFGNVLRIIQLSARHENSVFNVYLHPQGRIPRKITKKTGENSIQLSIPQISVVF